MSLDSEIVRYRSLTPASRAMWERARGSMPGGDTRTSVFWKPYPLFFTGGSGSRIRDEDGLDRIDFANSFTTLILGHADPDVVEAAQQQIASGAALGGGNALQVRLAEILCERIPSVELVRFTNSGTEALMNCVRAARAFTGRTRIAKAEGGYHGTGDATYVSVKMDPALLGDAQRPDPVAATGGVPASAVDEVVVLPFNDIDASRTILEANASELAAIVVEPMLGSSGMVPADAEYLRMLREVSSAHGTLLVFDEVITFRVSPGGAQESYGVFPDLTALGKVIGGGMPVGAFGGSAEVMRLFDPTEGPVVAHAGTFSGNPVTMAAGIAVLERLTIDVYERLGAMRDRLATGLSGVAAEFDVPLQVTGMGSTYGLHFREGAVRNYRDTADVDATLKQQAFLGLLNEGIVVAPTMVGALSTPMTDADLDAHVDALRQVLARR